LVNATALVNFGNGTGLEIGDWTYSTYLRSAPGYLPLNNATTSYLQASYPALAALLPDIYKIQLTSSAVVTMPSSQQWFGIGYGNGTWVAGAYGGTGAATSTDGTTWTARTSTGGMRSIAYGAGVFVSVASGGTQSSPTGVTWTARTAVAGEAVVYAAGTFVMVGANCAATSTDGFTWTTRTIPTGNWYRMAYGAGLFVAITDNNSIAATSPDGITWTSRTLPRTISSQGIAYGNGTFVIIDLVTSTKVMLSTDGITWVDTTTTSHVTSAVALVFGNGLFAATNGTSVSLSGNGVQWSTVAVPAYGASGPSLAYGDSGVFVSLPNGVSATPALRITAEVSTSTFTLPVVTPVTGTFTYVRAT